MLVAGPQAAPAGPALPASVTSFLGRERELHEVAELLSHRRLVTLTGAGGTGKTRLALAVASAVQARFADGAAFVPLAALRDPDLVAPAIARALGVPEARRQPWLDHLRDYLRSRRLLLVLDNFEQVAGAAPLLPGLLAACPGLAALVTSRGPLHVSAEQVYPVAPLPVPDSRRPPDVEELRRIPSVALFVERVRDVAPGFALTAQNAEPIMKICVRLEGLPLALELAAARAALLSPAALLRRLERRLRFLQGGLRDQPERHQTLRAAIAWSYDLLPAEEQRHFRHLALFVGGFTLEALAAIMGEGEEDALEAVARLGDQSLVLREDTPTGESRFQMLETIREFAWEQLEESGELAAAQRRHAEYFLSLAEQAEDQEAWLDRLEREHDNLRAALAWSTAADVDLALRFVGALWWFWDTRGHVQEGRGWCRRALAAEGGAPGLRAKALNTAGLLAQGQADYGPAVALLTEALALWRHLGDRSGLAIALNNLAVIARNQGDHQRVRALCEEALAALRRLGERQSAKDRQVLALVLYKLGWALGMEGDYERAAEWHTESLAIFEGTGERRGMARVHGSLGELALQRRDLAAAQDHLSRSLDLHRAIGDRWGIARSLSYLGRLAAAQGDHAGALQWYREGLALQHELGDRQGLAETLAGLARALLHSVGASSAARERQLRGVRLLAAAHALRAAIGAPPGNGEADDESNLPQVPAGLGQDVLQAAWAEGWRMGPDEAVACALATATAPRPEREQPASRVEAGQAGVLSPREREVARLIVRGLTNSEIAAALVISERTAANHVEHILNKLGFHSRAQVAAWAVEHGLR